jgi:hypothetical protein
MEGTRRTARQEGGLVLRVGPGVADPCLDGECGVERVGADHLLADELAYGAGLDLGHLEEQLVVHLED